MYYKLKGYWSNNRSKSNLKAHIILVSKYRHKLFNDPIKEDTKNIIQEIANKSDFEIIEMETYIDHIHIMIQYEPKLSISQIVRRIKQSSSKELWKIHKDFLNTKYWYRKCLWTDGYFVCSIGEASP